MMFDDNSNEPIMHVPAFNPNHFKRGMAIQFRRKDGKPYNAIIESVEHQTIRVIGLFEGDETVIKEIEIREVLLDQIVIRILAK